MHIPDGYLSPSTCASLYAAAAPFWWLALRRVQRQLSARLAPLISVGAAFSFVIMMFNLPLPGGTTGHAVGVGLTAVVLGPWASILAISAALLVQAVFFGDGGITTLGANCFNMAIAGSLVASAVYRTLSGSSPEGSPRRVVAAALGGYLAINAAAFLAALEFGIQPLLFHDATGMPLYAPYGLHIALPAMMLGHLTFAGWAEALLAGGVVAWLRHSDAAMLTPQTTAHQIGWGALRPFWLGLAALMIATPLGLLAAGTAWGEWAPADFTRPEARQQIAAGSLHAAPPPTAPVGMERLAEIWKAPIPDYAPPYLQNASLGYLLSAMLGVGLLILIALGLEWGLRRIKHQTQPTS